MEQIIHITSVGQVANNLISASPRHPLIDIIDFGKVDVCGTEPLVFTSDLYMVLLKDKCNGDIRYGRNDFDFNDGVLTFFAPGQVVAIEPNNESNNSSDGWGIFIHPDFMVKTALAKKMKDYTFFGYSIVEALHISDNEKTTLLNCIENMSREIANNLDIHSEGLVITNLELMLNYCTRFTERQFITRKKFTNHIVEKFEELVNDSIDSGNLETNGIPSVKQFAEQLFLTPNYLSDYLKKITGLSAKEHIQRKLMEEAKIRLLNNGGKSINEIAYGLGFENAPYFTRLFKKRVGMTPSDFMSNN